MTRELDDAKRKEAAIRSQLSASAMLGVWDEPNTEPAKRTLVEKQGAVIVALDPQSGFATTRCDSPFGKGVQAALAQPETSRDSWVTAVSSAVIVSEPKEMHVAARILDDAMRMTVKTASAYFRDVLAQSRRVFLCDEEVPAAATIVGKRTTDLRDAPRYQMTIFYTSPTSSGAHEPGAALLDATSAEASADPAELSLSREAVAAMADAERDSQRRLDELTIRHRSARRFVRDR